MKTLAVLSVALLASCGGPKPLTHTIVAPSGPAAAAVAPALAENGEASKSKLSKIAASGEAVFTINAGQPPGPRTDGIAGEAGIIAQLAGLPSPEDKAAALERSRVVAEGKAAEIAAAYAKAAGEAERAVNRANKAEADLQAATAAAEQERKTLAARYQAALDAKEREAQARVDAAVKDAEDKTRAEQRRTITWIFFGLGAALTAGGIVVLLTIASVPMFGPKVGFALMGAGGGLIALGIVITQIQNFFERHPWIVGGAVLTCALAAVAALVLMYSNHQHSKPLSV